MSQRLTVKDEKGRYVLVELRDDGTVRMIFEDGEEKLVKAEGVIIRQRFGLKRAILGLALTLQFPFVLLAQTVFNVPDKVIVTIASLLAALAGLTLFKLERKGFEVEILTENGKIKLEK